MDISLSFIENSSLSNPFLQSIWHALAVVLLFMYLPFLHGRGLVAQPEKMKKTYELFNPTFGIMGKRLLVVETWRLVVWMKLFEFFCTSVNVLLGDCNYSRLT